MEKIFLNEEYIKLDSALKAKNMVMSGGEAKTVIVRGEVFVNGELCTMRGKKLHPGDIFEYAGRSVKVYPKITLHAAPKQL
jgi:ribosome-associated protein